jgi:hypothetical protein
MKRLINPAPNGGVPYQNSDFNDILQYSSFNGLKQYYEFLCKELNISSLILNGFKIVGTGSNSFIVDTTDTFVYMNGEILSSSSSGTVSISNPFYLYENSPVYEPRQLRNNETSNVIVNRTWTFSTSNPSGNTTYSVGSTNSMLTFNLSSSYIRGYLNSELKGYLRPEVNGTFFDHTIPDTYNGIEITNSGPFILGEAGEIWARPYRDVSVTWKKPYISFMGSVQLPMDIYGNMGGNPITADYRVYVNIPNQNTTNYIINGCIIALDGNPNTATTGWAIEAKGATSFGLLIKESVGISQSLDRFEFVIIKSPDNTIVQCSTYSYPP